MQAPVLPLPVFLFTFRFLSRNAGAVLRRVAVPAILGGIALYMLLAAYLSGLSDYLDAPSSSTASRVLGIAAVSVLILFFFHTRLVSAIAELLWGARGKSFLGIRLHQWRLYVSNLQLLLIICAYCGIFWPVNALAEMLVLSYPVRVGLNAILCFILAWIVLRVGFFLLPLCASRNECEIMVRAWQISAGHFGKIALLVTLLMFPVAVFHVLLQILLAQLEIVPAFTSTMSIDRALDMQRSLLLPFVFLLGSTYVLGATLVTIASIRMYQLLTGSEIAASVP